MRFKVLFVFYLVFKCYSAWAVSENELSARFLTDLVPYVQNEYSQSSFNGVDGLKINYYYKNFNKPQGVIILVPGQSESSLKYSELLYDMKDWNYDIYIIDHRGQGESGRLLQDSEKSHVVRFSDYVEDLNTLITDIVKPERYKSAFVMAHSMGGAIASGFLSKKNNHISAALLFSPMFQINVGMVGQTGVGWLSTILGGAGFENNYAPGQGPYNENLSFENNQVTQSKSRYEMRKQLYNQFINIRVGGTTVNWLREAVDYTKSLRNKANVFTVPVVVFEAELDDLVLAKGIRKVCAEMNAKFCRVVNVKNARHEILNETDNIRNLILKQINSYLNYYTKKENLYE